MQSEMRGEKRERREENKACFSSHFQGLRAVDSFVKFNGLYFVAKVCFLTPQNFVGWYILH